MFVCAVQHLGYPCLQRPGLLQSVLLQSVLASHQGSVSNAVAQAATVQQGRCLLFALSDYEAVTQTLLRAPHGLRLLGGRDRAGLIPPSALASFR